MDFSLRYHQTPTSMHPGCNAAFCGITSVVPPRRSAFTDLDSGTCFPPTTETKGLSRARPRHITVCRIESHVSRRDIVRWAVSGISGVFLGSLVPRPAEAIYNPFAPPPDIVARLKQRLSEEAPERRFQEDLYYPTFFAGTWKTNSTLLSVACPAGYKLFGRLGSFEDAKKVSSGEQRHISSFVEVSEQAH